MGLFCFGVALVFMCPFVHVLCISGFFCFFPVLVIYKVVFLSIKKIKRFNSFKFETNYSLKSVWLKGKRPWSWDPIPSK